MELGADLKSGLELAELRTTSKDKKKQEAAVMGGDGLSVPLHWQLADRPSLTNCQNAISLAGLDASFELPKFVSLAWNTPNRISRPNLVAGSFIEGRTMHERQFFLFAGPPVSGRAQSSEASRFTEVLRR
jgi:hypothetical protein